jgi:hypothetical protein
VNEKANASSRGCVNVYVGYKLGFSILRKLL